ncbi:MAG: hypothetical protein LCH52_10430 [Bacteroidetes bacterium]|nr:hypothetical protein [Bacteroidota bacterium]
MRTKQSQTVMILMGIIIVLLLIVVGLFVITTNKEGNKEAQADRVKEPIVDTTPGYAKQPEERKPDSTRVRDDRKLSEIWTFFNEYSRANKEELTEELADLYSYPAIYGKNTFDREKMRSTLFKFFDNTDPLDHYFTDLVAYEFDSGTISAYITEFQSTIDRRQDKKSDVKVYKNFRLIPTNRGYKCSEQHIISVLRP